VDQTSEHCAVLDMLQRERMSCGRQEEHRLPYRPLKDLSWLRSTLKPQCGKVCFIVKSSIGLGDLCLCLL
jgi:hypothetical protein